MSKNLQKQLAETTVLCLSGDVGLSLENIVTAFLPSPYGLGKGGWSNIFLTKKKVGNKE